MLDVKEAENNIRKYIADNLLFKYSDFRSEVLETYKRNHRESLDVAKKLFEEGLSNLWVVVCSYYSMYYIANAVLYKIGYKIGSRASHKVTADSLIVFVRNKLKKSLIEDYEKAKEEALDIIGRKTDEIISSFGKEMEKRSIFQYETTEEIKKTKAETSLEMSETFHQSMTEGQITFLYGKFLSMLKNHLN